MDRITLGITGLDEMLGGGVPKNHNVLVAGGPGTGKTTFGIQYLYQGIKNHNEKGLFITLEEKSESIIKNMEESFDWKLKEEINNGNLLIQSVDRYNFQNLLDVCQSSVVNHGVKRVVLDTVTMLRLFFKDDFEFRKGLFNLLDFLGSMDATVVLTSERNYSQREEASFGLEEFISDGVILLYNLPRKNERITALEILKMRGVKHSKSIYPFQISKSGISVVPEEILWF